MSKESLSGQSVEIDISKISDPKVHDRKSFSDEEIDELAQNIQSTNGLLQPIIVRKVDDGYERIAGFRRLEAVKRLGWSKIPAIVVDDVDDSEAMLMMLSENIQRADLNPYDQTVGILEYISLSLKMDIEDVKKLLYRFRNIDNGVLKQIDDKSLKLREQMEEITKRLGNISVATLINRLKIFSLSEHILKALKEGKIGYSAAQEINKAGDPKRIVDLLKRVEKEKLSLREIKKIIKEQKNPSKKPKNKPFYTLTDEGGWVSITVENITAEQIKKLENFLKKL